MCSTKMYHPASFPPNADNLWKMSSKCKITNYFLTLQAQRCWSDFCFVNIIIRRFIIAMRRANSLFAALASCCYPIQSVPLLSSPSLLCLNYHKTELVQSVQVARQQCSCFLSHACTCSQTDPILGRSVRQIKWFEKCPWEFVFWAWEKWLCCWSTQCNASLYPMHELFWMLKNTLSQDHDTTKS